MQRVAAVGLFVTLTVCALLLVAGHGWWAGATFWSLDADHGLNTGDVPVIASWGVGSVACWLLWSSA
ncbi:hypothetical protein [Nocardioides sp. Leaf307]|uniref:hypothetical protein n=1 Tax=Nocardioides sp. Leaf307 TaxID=1736331 RepID=UPI0007025B11|nr:hypothetical protein [Nocardioides sp. Leaf307]KQQ42936.1 hypothetical protein ASF50_02675 [Nocardioides sp. Leaf307]